jgi:hypothetical protein
LRFIHSDGWNLRDVIHGETNNLGYIAPFDYTFGEHAVIVLGDSFVENAMNDYRDSLQGQLQIRSAAHLPIMNFGYSGGSLSDYLGVASLAGHKFQAEWVIVVVVPGDFVDGFGSEPGFFRWAPEQAVPIERVADRGTKSSIKKIVRSIALVRYVKGQLGVSLQSLFGYSQGSKPAGCVAPRLEPGDAKLIERVAESFPSAAGVPPSRVILVFDPDVHPLHDQRLMGGRSLCVTRDSLARKVLAHSAAEAGMHVIDMQPIFAAYVASTSQRIDQPDSHWNGTGNRLAASAIAEVIDHEQPAHTPRLVDPVAAPSER